MDEPRGVKEYKSDKELFSNFLDDIYHHFEPFFSSYANNKKNFGIQIINLALVFLSLYFVFDPILNKLSIGIEGDVKVAIQFLYLMVGIILVSTIKNNKIIKWQTLFKTEYIYTKKWCKRLIVVNILAFLGKNFIYDKSSK